MRILVHRSLFGRSKAGVVVPGAFPLPGRRGVRIRNGQALAVGQPLSGETLDERIAGWVPAYRAAELLETGEWERAETDEPPESIESGPQAIPGASPEEE